MAGEGRREGGEEGVVRGKGTPVGKPEEEEGGESSLFFSPSSQGVGGRGAGRKRGIEGGRVPVGRRGVSVYLSSRIPPLFLTPTKLKLLYH